MATVGSHKGNRGRPYGLMLLLAFGVALIGVMALHRVRERHIFNHLIQEKDKELNSLQLLLQNEKDQNKELKRTSEEVKGRLYSLGAQKMELDNKVLEMQSRVESIKDEQKTMESALDEKQNEIKWLKERYADSLRENPNLTVLMGRLKQKESEIEDLKHKLESSVKVWSVSGDDPSKNMTGSGSTIIAAERENLTKAEQRSENSSIYEREGLNASENASTVNSETTTDQNGMARKQTENFLTSENKESIDGVPAGGGNRNETQHMKNENFQAGESAGKFYVKNAADAIEANFHNGYDTGKPRSEVHEQIREGEYVKKTEDRHQEDLGISSKANGQPRRLLKDEMSKEIDYKFRTAVFSKMDMHGIPTRMKAKGRLLHGHENSETSGFKDRIRRFYSQGPYESKNLETAETELKMGNRHSQMNIEALKGTSNSDFSDHRNDEVGQSEDQEMIERADFSEPRNRTEERIEADEGEVPNSKDEESLKAERDAAHEDIPISTLVEVRQ